MGEPTYRCVSAASVADIEPHLAAWNDLMSRSLEDNFYLSPAFVMATLRNLMAGSQYVVVFVYRRDPDEEHLALVAPFSVRRPDWRMPFTALSGLASPHGYLSHPLLDRDDGGGALATLWQWLERPEHPWRMIFFHGIGVDSPFLPRLEHSLVQQQRHFLEKCMFWRPMLKRHDSFEAYLAALPPARRKNYKRRWRQLEKAGTVEVVAHRRLDDAEGLAERFAQLECLGWKGHCGTALACTTEGAAFFRELVESCGRIIRIFFVELKLNGRLLAMTSNFVCGRTLFAFKIAYDPAFGEFSPGILTELQTVRLFHETPELQKGEGGATAVSYLSSYWRDLTEMRAVYIALRGWRARCYLSTLATIWRVKHLRQHLAGGQSRCSA